MGNKRNRGWRTPDGYVRVSVICKTAFALKVLGAISHNVTLQSMFEWSNNIRGSGLGQMNQPRYRKHPMPLLDQITKSDGGDTLYPKQVTVETNGQSEILLTPYLYSAWHATNQGDMPDCYETIEAWALELQRRYPRAFAITQR